MLKRLSFPLILLLLLIVRPDTILAQNSGTEEASKVYLVLMDLEADIDVTFLYSKKYDKKFASIEYAVDDSINNLDDFSYYEPPLAGPECFIPEIKLVYESHTYVISLYCAKVIKYRNKTPWFTSQQRLKNDLLLTPRMVTYLDNLRIKHFGSEATNQEFLKGVATGQVVEELQDNGAELDWLFNEDMLDDADDESDLEFEEERILPEEEDPEYDDDDGLN
ncbi:MAG: hypothetical protein AB8H47_22535 [Bacteroidia bacterium]